MEEIIFPNQIRMYRRLRGKSMQELADHLSVSLSAISKIEKGYRRVDQEQLVRVAEFLDCPLQDLFVNEQNSQQEIVQAWRREQERRNKINEKTGLKTLGAGLRQIRNEKNLTLIEVAESADMTLSVYHRIEMGQREVSDKEMKNIAKALNTTCEGDNQTVITSVAFDSRKITDGGLFVPLEGERDGHEFIASAINNGASFLALSSLAATAENKGTYIDNAFSPPL